MSVQIQLAIYQYDLTSPDYSITRDNALTLHGKKRIAEEQ